MAFVVIMHLSPDFESNLASILQQRTTMPVLQVAETTQVLPNHVYVIPPSRHLLLQDGRIELIEPQQAAGKRLAVDLFFRTLSAAYGPRAVAIVLSGVDSDGAIGIKHIKEQGGLALVQEPTEAEYDGMPRSAIATGMVDWVLPVPQMAARLLDFMRNEARMHVPPEDLQSEADAQAEDRNSGGPLAIRKEANAGDEEALREVLVFVRTQTGHDFTQYKRATILRRVARRLQVNLLEDIPTYLEFLRLHPSEVTALLHDLLISVTNFFRDPQAFAVLEGYIPQLFADKKATEEVRVWVAGCATGEEAYSVAIMLSEYAARLDTPPSIQVFATDLDANAIQIARSGVYPATIEADVSSERLRRFFHKDEGRYHIKKELRERVLFSVHNLLKDSPFSRLDMVTCRNLLIYLKREAQEGIFDLFHFALRSSGLLFLGSAESVSDGHALFAPADRQNRLFVRRTTARPGWQLPAIPTGPAVSSLSAPPVAPAQVVSGPNVGASATAPHSPATSASERRRSPYADLHVSVLEQFAPPSLLVNTSYDIVHLSEHAGRFLQFSGELSRNLLEVVHPALRMELRTALFRAGHQRIDVKTGPILFEEGNWDAGKPEEKKPYFVTIHVRPARAADATQEFLLVVFEAGTETVEAPVPAFTAPDALTRHLEEEILHLRQQLSATVEQYEASLEELKAANEEQQSINEEMRSTTEELETSKEELQSTNEELTTVNQELKSSVDELSRANGDLQNLMASTEIGTIFLDRQLHIKRYTPRVRELFNIIPTDVGRPLSDITHKLNYQSFTPDAEHVLDTLTRSEREVSNDGHHYIARMLPYRTPDDYIDGVVLTFIDITERKHAAEALRESNERLRALFDSMSEAFVIKEAILDEQGKVVDYRFVETNPAFTRHTGISDPRGRTVRELIPDIESIWLDNYAHALRTGEPTQFEAFIVSLDRWLAVSASRMGQEGSRRIAIVFSDITERKRAEEQRIRMERDTTLLVERNRMAQELHDTLAQGLTAIKFQTELAGHSLEETPPDIPMAQQHLARAQELTVQSHQEARRSVHALRSPLLEQVSLVEAFEQMAQQASDGVEVAFISEGTPTPQPGLIENDLYRIGQEALTNALRHGAPQHVWITLAYRAADLRLTIRDDGRGFSADAGHTGFGMIGMLERAQRLGAELRFDSRPGEGTEVTLILPLTSA